MGKKSAIIPGSIKASDEVERLLKGAKIDIQDERWRYVNDLYGKIIKLKALQEQDAERKKELLAVGRKLTSAEKDIKAKESSIIYYLKAIRKDQGLSTESTEL